MDPFTSDLFLDQETVDASLWRQPSDKKIDKKIKPSTDPIEDFLKIFTGGYADQAQPFAGYWTGPNFSANRLLRNGDKLTAKDLAHPAYSELDRAAKFHDISYNLALGLETKEERDKFLDLADKLLRDKAVNIVNQMLVGYDKIPVNLGFFESIATILKLPVTFLINAPELAVNFIFELINHGHLARPDFKKLDLTPEDVEMYKKALIEGGELEFLQVYETNKLSNLERKTLPREILIAIIEIFL